jgi:hypothetical protein
MEPVSNKTVDLKSYYAAAGVSERKAAETAGVTALRVFELEYQKFEAEVNVLYFEKGYVALADELNYFKEKFGSVDSPDVRALYENFGREMDEVNAVILGNKKVIEATQKSLDLAEDDSRKINEKVVLTAAEFKKLEILIGRFEALLEKVSDFVEKADYEEQSEKLLTLEKRVDEAGRVVGLMKGILHLGPSTNSGTEAR